MNTSNTPLISVVIPVFRAELMIVSLIKDISNELVKISEDYEVILVEDGGPDNSWKKIQECCNSNHRIKGIKLSRNFGQHSAITAGLTASKGKWVVVMDCDYQDDPVFIPKLYEEARKGFDLVFGKRMDRTDGYFKKISSRFFYRVFSYLTDSDFDGSIGNYGIYSRKVVDSILSMKEPFKFFVLMARWVGFKNSAIDVLHGARKEGKSSYTFSALINLALLIILTYSQKPLMLTVKAGLLISGLSIVYTAYNIIEWYLGGITVLGYASLIASVWFIGGMIIFILGIIGLYLGKAFEGIKNRPVFIVDCAVNIAD